MQCSSGTHHVVAVLSHGLADGCCVVVAAVLLEQQVEAPGGHSTAQHSAMDHKDGLSIAQRVKQAFTNAINNHLAAAATARTAF